MSASPLIAKKWNYYNDFDDNVVAWTKELIKRGLIPDGEVDGRSILDVNPADLAGFTQCHWFSGVCGWPLALRLAGWPDDKPVWTGSPPCQPFSVAGKGLAADDPRHLGPAFVRLVRSARPGVLFGEQVASADVFGHVAGGRKRGVAGQPQWTWIDDLFLRLEAARYAAWAVDYPSASLGAPHIRQRTYFGAVRMADADGRNPCAERQQRGGEHRFEQADGDADPEPATGPTYGPWGDADWLYCRDGRWRPVESGTFPLAHGVPARVGRLRGYGNAINPHQAAHFIRTTYRD